MTNIAPKDERSACDYLERQGLFGRQDLLADTCAWHTRNAMLVA